jgi:hypothetical protein
MGLLSSQFEDSKFDKEEPKFEPEETFKEKVK